MLSRNGPVEMKIIQMEKWIVWAAMDQRLPDVLFVGHLLGNDDIPIVRRPRE